MLRHSCRACARPRKPRSTRPSSRRARLAERRVPPDEHADGPRRRAGRVLGLRAHQLAADAAVPEGVARALRGRGAARDRRAHAGLLVRARSRHRGARGGAARDPVRGGARPRLSGLARVRQQGLAGPLPVRPHRQAGATSTTARASTRTPSAPSARSSGSTSSRIEPMRPEDEPGVLLEPQTADIALPGDRDRLELVRDWTDGEDWIAAADAGAAASFELQRRRGVRGAVRAAAWSPGSTRWRGRSRRSRRASASTACSSRPRRQRLS